MKFTQISNNSLAKNKAETVKILELPCILQRYINFLVDHMITRIPLCTTIILGNL
jgi:hypothetical protein